MTARPFLYGLLLASTCCPVLRAACGTSADPAAVVQAQVDAYNKHDLDTFLSCYADNATITMLGGQKPPMQGMAALRTMYTFLSKIPPAGAGYGVDILAKTVTGPTVANVEHVRGTQPGHPAPPDTLVIYEVRDGKILNVWFAPAS